MSKRPIVLGSLVTSTLFTVLAATGGVASAASSVDYVALGDSYSSGVGTSGQTGTCLRSPNAYPGLWVSAHSPKSFTNLTCAGAVTDDVIGTQAPSIPSGTDLVSITIGGNDVGFADTVLTCKFLGDSACASAVASAEDTARTELPSKLDATYAAIKAKAPGAKVVVLDYPRLFDTTSADCGLGAMSLANRKVLNEGADVLDGIIKARTQAAAFTYAEVRDNFATHGICATTPYLNGFTLIPATDSYHPNQSGYTYGYLPAFTAAA